jgi:cell division initiation protein
MKITPLDIEQKSFSVKLRGFDRDEVNAFLKSISAELEGLLRDISNFREEISKKDKQLKDFGDMELSLRNVLLATQKMVEQCKQDAHKDAHIMRREAEIQAQRVGEAQQKVIKIYEDIAALKKRKRQFKAEFRLLIENHLKMLDSQIRAETADEVNKKADKICARGLIGLKQSQEIADRYIALLNTQEQHQDQNVQVKQVPKLLAK